MPVVSWHRSCFRRRSCFRPKGEFYTPGFPLYVHPAKLERNPAKLERNPAKLETNPAKLETNPRSWKRFQRSWPGLNDSSLAGSNGFVRPDTLNAGCRAGAFLWSCRGAWANLRRGGTSVIRGSVRARQWLSRLTRSNASNATSPLASQCSHASHGKPNQGGSRIWPAIACRLMTLQTQQLNRPSRRLNAGIGRGC